MNSTRIAQTHPHLTRHRSDPAPTYEPTAWSYRRSGPDLSPTTWKHNADVSVSRAPARSWPNLHGSHSC